MKIIYAAYVDLLGIAQLSSATVVREDDAFWYGDFRQDKAFGLARNRLAKRNRYGQRVAETREEAVAKLMADLDHTDRQIEFLLKRAEDVRRSAERLLAEVKANSRADSGEGETDGCHED
ncbi:MAG: hypothetical protein KDD44_00275 [Bdellovibrionales bacterium]|nr:hypothetical protein [Bdellovibrionales bacterium]